MDVKKIIAWEMIALAAELDFCCYLCIIRESDSPSSIQTSH